MHKYDGHNQLITWQKNIPYHNAGYPDIYKIIEVIRIWKIIYHIFLMKHDFMYQLRDHEMIKNIPKADFFLWAN